MFLTKYLKWLKYQCHKIVSWPHGRGRKILKNICREKINKLTFFIFFGMKMINPPLSVNGNKALSISKMKMIDPLSTNGKKHYHQRNHNLSINGIKALSIRKVGLIL